LNLDNWNQLQQDLGIKLAFKDNGNDPGPVVTQMVSGTAAEDFDLGGLQGGSEAELAKAGRILPWDLTKIPNWNSIWPWARDIPYAKNQGQQFGIPVVINADSIIYLPDKVGEVDSYSVVFDPKLKGKTSMEDAWINSAIFAAIYLKQNSLANIQNPGDMTPDELGTVMEFLIKKKKEGQFRKFWSGWEEGLQLIRSQEVWAMTGWEPIVLAAQKAGINAKYAVPKEGYEGWSNDLVLHLGAQARGLVDLAHQFVNWELNGYYGCALSQLRGYVVPTDKASEYAHQHPDLFDPQKIDTALQHVREKFLKQGGQTFWQNTRPKEFKLYEEWWSKLRSA
jgi:putative spermidine/putrescine transport system substrate-binding protein